MVLSPDIMNSISTKISTSYKYSTTNNLSFDPKTPKLLQLLQQRKKHSLSSKMWGNLGNKKNFREKKLFKFQDMKLIPESINSSLNLINKFKFNIMKYTPTASQVYLIFYLATVVTYSYIL